MKAASQPEESRGENGSKAFACKPPTDREELEADREQEKGKGFAKSRAQIRSCLLARSLARFQWQGREDGDV